MGGAPSHEVCMQPFSVAMSGRALTAAVLCASQQNKARLVQFYQQHNPDKLKDVHPPPLPKPLEPLSCADHTRRVSENAVRLIAGRQNAQSLRRPSERPLARPRQGTLLTLLSRPPWAWSTRMRDPGNMSARVVTRNVTAGLRSGCWVRPVRGWPQKALQRENHAVGGEIQIRPVPRPSPH